MQTILVPIICLYQMLDHNLAATLITLRRLKKTKARIILAANYELTSYPELDRAVVRLLSYQPHVYSLSLHPSLNDKHYLDALINRSNTRLNKQNHALLINPPKLKYYANGDPNYLTQINSKLELNTYLNTQSES